MAGTTQKVKSGVLTRLDRTRQRTASAPAPAQQPFAVAETDENTRWLPVNLVRPMGSEWTDITEEARTQPRRHFDEEKMRLLSESLAADEQLIPILVREIAINAGGDIGYGIITGERRWRAAQAAGKEFILARIIRADQRKAFRLAVIEDAHNEKWNGVERGNAIKTLKADMEQELAEFLERAEPRGANVKLGPSYYKRMLEEAAENTPRWIDVAVRHAEESRRRPTVKWEDVSKVIGLEERMMRELVNLAELPDEIIADIEEGKLTDRQARAVLTVKDEADQKKLAREIQAQGLSSTAAAARAAALNNKKAPAPKKADDRRGRDPVAESLRPAVSLATSAANAFETITLTHDYRTSARKELKLLRRQLERMEKAVG